MKKKLVLMTSALMAISLLVGCKQTHSHEWGDVSYTWAEDNSTCTATRVCKGDKSHVETETVDTTSVVVTEAKCEEDGLKRYTADFKTNEAFLDQTKDVTLEAFGHEWGTPTYTWSNDYSSCTATRVCENDPNHMESETVDSTSVETEASYLVEGSITYTATFTNAAFSTQTYKQKTSDKIPYYGEVPLLSEDGKTLTYGLYPQKNVNDSALVSALNELAAPESNGWYLYNNGYYAKASATPYNEDSKIREFDNGTEIEEGTTYWFKCEPITWNVLSNNNGEYYILSSVLLDAHCYDASKNDEEIDDVTIHPNNYEHSDIRAWLNKEFYNSAFALHNSYIQETTVDNSASTTDSPENKYTCEETEDKVFLPSYQDYINSSYGFSEYDYESRYCKTTDWARARGAYCNRYSDYLYNGYYWTRSPCSILQSGVEYVTYDGTIQLEYTYYTYYSVRPALSIKIA